MTPDSTAATRAALDDYIRRLPKAELHLHIEGTLEPELIFDLACRNKVSLPYPDIESLQQAYRFENLQSFLDLYYAGARVLISEDDFYEMTWAYLERVHGDGVVHVEIMFDPQTHTARGVHLDAVFAGIARALRQARVSLGMSGYMIMCFLRHLPEASALETLAAALTLREEYRDLWIAVGLDSAEVGNPPEKFARVFDRCRALGFRLVAHAGEEGPPEYVRTAMDVLGVERIDHGVRSEEDPALLQEIIEKQIPLTVCPLSNVRLAVVSDLRDHNLARLLRQGARVTVNSDDPAYFGGYLAHNYIACAEALGLSRAELRTLACNSFTASFLSDDAKRRWLERMPAA